MGLLVDFLRAVADGFEKAAGQDPVDKHADDARALLDDGDVPCGKRHNHLAFVCTESLGHGGHHAQHRDDGLLIAAWPNPDLIAADEQAAIDRERLDDPDVVELTGPIPEHEIGLRLGVALRDAKAKAAEYEREIGRLNDQLAEKPYRIDTGERVLQIRPGEGVIVEIPSTSDPERAAQMRDRLENRFPGVRFALIKSAKQIQIRMAAEQKVLDAAREWADIWSDGREKYIADPRSRALYDTLRALDTAEDQR